MRYTADVVSEKDIIAKLHCSEGTASQLRKDILLAIAFELIQIGEPIVQPNGTLPTDQKRESDQQ